MIIGVDVGGTFTDFVSVDTVNERVATRKVLTSYPDPSESVRNVLDEAVGELSGVTQWFHGTTVGINAIIQRSAPPCAIVTTAGFKDVLELRKGSRSEIWDVRWAPLAPLIPRHLRFEVAERTDPDGRVEIVPTEKELQGVLVDCVRSGVQSIGVAFINAYANPDNERRAAEIIGRLAPDLYVSVASDLSRELGEYERTSTVAANAMLRPVVDEYLARLTSFLEARQFRGSAYVMQSSGGVTSLKDAGRAPALIVESGPAAGVAATAEIASASGISSAISFDMGGTTAKACVIVDGLPQLTPAYTIGGGRGYVLQVPGVDIVEVGTGGGSVAYVDAAGALRVGPRSAGSTPGPACYGRGGTEPTITDANVLLGRIGASGLADGTMALDVSAARRAMTAVAEPLGQTVEELSAGIVEIASVMMAGAVRRVTIERGLDPREFVLFGYGGAGPLHVCDIARLLHIPRVVVPPYPGHFSALGMLLTNVRKDYARTVLTPLDASGSLDRIRRAYDEMSQQAVAELDVKAEDLRLDLSADMRYVGQHHTVTVQIPSLDSLEAIASSFGDVFSREFAHEHGEGSPELVTARLAAVVIRRSVGVGDVLGRRERCETEDREREVWFDGLGPTTTRVVQRSEIERGATIEGPVLVEEGASTTVLSPGDTLTVSDLDCLEITVATSEDS